MLNLECFYSKLMLNHNSFTQKMFKCDDLEVPLIAAVSFLRSVEWKILFNRLAFLLRLISDHEHSSQSKETISILYHKFHL